MFILSLTGKAKNGDKPRCILSAMGLKSQKMMKFDLDASRPQIYVKNQDKKVSYLNFWRKIYY